MKKTESAAEWKKQRIEDINKALSENKYADFIDDALFEELAGAPSAYSKEKTEELTDKALSLKGLELSEAAYLINLKEPSAWEKLFRAAREVKDRVYGNRIVLFAPLYMGSRCVNNCAYCGMREDNSGIVRKNLSFNEITGEIKALASQGHKRLLLVYGEHSAASAENIAADMKTIYAYKNKTDVIRRVNVNAAPLFEDEYSIIKDAGIGTYQVFQETYKRKVYDKLHPAGSIKNIYDWRLFAQHRAQKAGIDDVAIGVLFGLYDWKYEVLSLIAHANALEKEFGAGAHTISFPRLENAFNTSFAELKKYAVSDEDMRKIITILRLAVPYTGLILTAREKPGLRKELIKLGVSQTDAGTSIAVGGYSEKLSSNILNRQQFEIADTRSLEEYIFELTKEGYIPSFCTAGYRCGRTGCEFMDFARAGKVKNFCVPNAILTFKEYLEDYAGKELKEFGSGMIENYINDVEKNFSAGSAAKIREFLKRIENGERDIYF